MTKRLMFRANKLHECINDLSGLVHYVDHGMSTCNIDSEAKEAILATIKDLINKRNKEFDELNEESVGVVDNGD